MDIKSKTIINLINDEEVSIEKYSENSVFDERKEKNIPEIKREPALLESYQGLLSEVKLLLEDDEENALSQLSIEKAEKALDKLSTKMSDMITQEVLSDAKNETKNPLIEEETNRGREEMMRNVSGALSIKKLPESYPFINAFDYNDFTMDSLSLEEEKMLSFYYTKCSELLEKKDNVKTLQEFSKDMLSDEFDIFLEDIARF